METKTYGTPCNNKSLLAYTMNILTRLDAGEISNEDVIARCKTINTAMNVYRTELMREQTECLIAKTNAELGTAIELRQIESKKFDNATLL